MSHRRTNLRERAWLIKLADQPHNLSERDAVALRPYVTYSETTVIGPRAARVIRTYRLNRRGQNLVRQLLDRPEAWPVRSPG